MNIEITCPEFLGRILRNYYYIHYTSAVAIHTNMIKEMQPTILRVITIKENHKYALFIQFKYGYHVSHVKFYEILKHFNMTRYGCLDMRHSINNIG